MGKSDWVVVCLQLLCQELLQAEANPTEPEPEPTGRKEKGKRDAEPIPKTRSEVALLIKETIPTLGGTNIAWDQLSRSRTPYGPNAGLQMLTNMLTATDEDGVVDRSGIEPAIQILALFCNFKQYVQTIARLRKIVPALIGVLKIWQNTRQARASSTWVLRRVTEFSAACRLEVASNQGTLVLLHRVMMSDDLRPEDTSPDVLLIGENSRASTPGRPSMGGNLQGSGSMGGKLILQRPPSKSPASPSSPAPDGMPKAPGGPPNVSLISPHPGPGPLGLPVTASLPARPITAQSGGSQVRISRPGTAVTHASRPATAASPTRPGTALATTSRPTTSLRPSTSGTISFFSVGHIRPDVMCMEANCCAAIGNCALREDVLDRLGKSQGIMSAIIHLLENGSYWAQGHAARALGNLLPSLDNVKFLAKADNRNVAAQAVRTFCLLLSATDIASTLSVVCSVT